MGSRTSTNVLITGALLLSCTSASPSRQSAFILHRPSITLSPTNRRKRPITLRVLADRHDDNSDEEGHHIEDDELIFQRTPSYQRSNYEGYYDEDEEDELQSQINKISWLPSLLSTRRPRSTYSRKENTLGLAYDSLDRMRKDIEVLPVLPLQMIKKQDNDLSYASGVWVDADENDMFSSTTYLPHTNNHVFAIAEPRYKKMYDDLLQLGEYWGQKRKEALRDANGQGIDLMYDEDLPNPEEKRRFIGTIMHPSEEGVLAQYGVLFQLKDLDEVAAIASYDEQISMEEIRELMADHDDFNDADFADVMLDTHYEASHDIVGIVKLHRVVNPECWTDDPENEEYLMAEATVTQLFTTKDPTKLVSTAEETIVAKASRVELSVAKQLEGQSKQQAASQVSDAITRIKEELRAAVDEAFTKQHHQTKTGALYQQPGEPDIATAQPNNQIPLVPKGVLIEKRPDGSPLIKEEHALRDSFARLVSLQQELKETYRFTRDSVKSFGIGSVGLWLSTAAWSKFIDKRLEGANAEIQSELQSQLTEYLSNKSRGESDEVEQETIDFDELPSYLQNKYIAVRERAMEELGPAALQRALQLQSIIQAPNDTERLKLLKKCVDEESRRLLAKKMLQQALSGYQSDEPLPPKTSTQQNSRAVIGKVLLGDQRDEDDKFPPDAFQ